MKDKIERLLSRTNWEFHEVFYKEFNTLADIAIGDNTLTICPCCKSAWLRDADDKYFCKCVVHTKEYANRTNGVKYREDGYHELDLAWMEKFDKDPNRCCFGHCTIEGIMGSCCRKCGTYVGCDEYVCGGCLERIIEHFGSDKLLTNMLRLTD